MKVVTVINHLDIRVFFDKIHIFRRDMRTVQICHVDIFSIFHQPVPDTGQVFLSVEDLDSHLLQRRRIRFLMEVIISDKFNNIPLFQEHFQVLERCLGTSVFVKGRHIVIDHDNDLFAHAALACAEWIRIAVVDALVLKLFFPFFFELLAVFHLIPFQTGSVDIRSVGNAFEMDDLGFWLVNDAVARFPHLKCQIRIFAVRRGKPLVETADLLPECGG